MKDEYFCSKRIIGIEDPSVYCVDCVKSGLSGYTNIRDCKNRNLICIDDDDELEREASDESK